MNATADGENITFGSKRVGAIVARSDSSFPIVGQPVLMKLGDAVLGRQALRMDRTTLKDRTRLKQIPWGLHLTQLIGVAPGVDAQGLHYDGPATASGIYTGCGADGKL